MKNGKTILFPKSQLSQENVTKGSVSQTVPNECWRIAIAKLTSKAKSMERNTINRAIKTESLIKSYSQSDPIKHK